MRLLGVTEEEAAQVRDHITKGDRRSLPGAVRASCGLATTTDDVDALLGALRQMISQGPEGSGAGHRYEQDPTTGDFRPIPAPPWWGEKHTDAQACVTQ